MITCLASGVALFLGVLIPLYLRWNAGSHARWWHVALSVLVALATLAGLVRILVDQWS